MRNWPAFFAAVRNSGVRLAIFGFEDPSLAGTPEQVTAATRRHNSEVRRAVILGANIVITTHPNYFPDH